MKLLSKLRNQSWFTWASVTVLFFLVSWLHMGPSLTHCNTVVLSKAGDHTAGIMYNSWVRPGRPFLGHSTYTNYPYGENLWLPTSLSTQVMTTGHWVLSRLTNIVCAWNLMVLFGYMSSALLMFCFMRWLVKDSWVALFAAYATTYTPYHVFSSWGHLTWLYTGLFTLALWQFIALWRKPSRLKGLGLGATIGIGFYADGYFILIGALLLFSFWLAAISYAFFLLRRRFSTIKSQLQALSLASLISFVMLLPLGWANHHYAAQVTAYLGTIRGDIMFDAQTYSARLYMYFMPTKFFPVIGKYAQDFQSTYFKNDGFSGLLFLGFSVVALALFACWWLFRSARRSRSQATKVSPFLFVAWTALIFTILSVWFSLQPKSQLGSLTIYNPSYLVILLTPAWRVFGRLYVLVNLGFVTLAGLGLAELLRRYPARRWLLIGLSLVILVLELRVFPASALGPTFDYTKAPAVYTWLHNNPEVRAVAEYPLDEQPQGKYLAHYHTFQVISGKPLLNSLSPNSPGMPLRRSIVGINDPQTLPVLRALGIDLVNIRPITPLTAAGTAFDARQAALTNPELERIFTDDHEIYKVDSFRIKAGRVADYALVIPSLNYAQIVLTSDGGAKYLVGNNIDLRIVKLPYSKSQAKSVVVSFDISSDSAREISIIQNGKVLWSGNISAPQQTLNFEASPDYPLTIYNQVSTQATLFTISRLQIL